MMPADEWATNVKKENEKAFSKKLENFSGSVLDLCSLEKAPRQIRVESARGLVLKLCCAVWPSGG